MNNATPGKRRIFNAEKGRYAAIRGGPLRIAAYLPFSALKLNIEITAKTVLGTPQTAVDIYLQSLKDFFRLLNPDE